MKKNKLSVITFIISLLPFITLLISLFTEEITGGLQTGLIVLNVISILSGFVLSVSLVKNPKRRDVFSIVALCVSAFFGFLMFGILAFGLIATFFSKTYKKDVPFCVTNETSFLQSPQIQQSRAMRSSVQSIAGTGESPMPVAREVSARQRNHWHCHTNRIKQPVDGVQT